MSNSTNSSVQDDLASQQNSCRAFGDPMGVSNNTQKDVGSEKECCQDGKITAGGIDHRFSCNICFDEVVEPVVTTCGHLYCWPCLFQWLEPGMTQEERESLGLSPFRYGGSNRSRRVCPMSKSPLPLSSVIPVYVRSSESPSSRTSSSKTSIENKTMNEVNTKADQSENDLSEPENNENSNDRDSATGHIDQGLRRRRNRTSDHSINNSESVPVPNRPSVTRPQHNQEEPSSPPMARRSSPGSSPQATDNPYRVGGVQLTPRSPNGHNGSLANGIISSLQRATAEYYRNTHNTNEEERRHIPSLHDRRNPLNNHSSEGGRRFGDSGEFYPRHDEGYGNLNSETTQYLTRLLIMLTSFVIFCFLVV